MQEDWATGQEEEEMQTTQQAESVLHKQPGFGSTRVDCLMSCLVTGMVVMKMLVMSEAHLSLPAETKSAKG